MSRIIGVVVVIAIAAGVFYYRSSRTDQANDAVDAMPARIMTVAARTPGFAEHRQYFLAHADKAHQHAIDVSYSTAGRRRSASFDPRRYAAAFGESMLNQGKLTRSDQKLDQFLRQLRIDLEQAAAKGVFD